MSPLSPAMIIKGGKDTSGSWGTSKTFVRELVVELYHVPIPMFLASPLIPAYNSIHPIYPFAIAKDSRITNNIESQDNRRTVTVETNYQILKLAFPLLGLSGWDVAAFINNNLPPLLPAQDVTYESVTVEEPLDYLYVREDNEWEDVPFQTTSGTKLTGTRLRNILKMSFWYFALPWIDEAALVTRYTGAINSENIIIAGRLCPAGTAKIESIEVFENTWERDNAVPYPLKMIKVVLLLDNQTWCKRFENVSSLFMAYPYDWHDSDSGKEKVKMKLDSDNQPLYKDKSKHVSAQRIFCTMYDPEPKDEGEDEPIWVSDPHNAISFFGTREECFRLNPDSEPTEVTEPMYLDEKGFILYPDPSTGKVDTTLSPKIEGYDSCPMNFTPLGFPIT